MEQEIDAVDYGVLKCLAENGGCWKNKVHGYIEDNQDALPGMGEKSVQTVGRRIDELHEAGYVESCILSPDTINRDMIIGYKLTADGKQAVRQERQRLLKKQTLAGGEAILFPDKDVDVSISRDALIELLCDEFDINDAVRDDVVTECSTQELVAVLISHYFRTDAVSQVDDDAVDRIATLIMQTPRLLEPYTANTLPDRIRERMARNAQSVDGTVWKQVSDEQIEPDR